jgi:hypothetical protein
MELHVHHLHRTADNPWEEPDLHLLTVCKLCHEQQPGNPRGGFKNPKRLYLTDQEWWKKHRSEYSEELDEVLTIGPDNDELSGSDIHDCVRRLRRIEESLHILRLEWENSGAPFKILVPYVGKGWPQPCEIEMDELWVAFQKGGPGAITEVLKRRREAEGRMDQKGKAPQLNESLPHYPTEQQMDAVWQAYLSDGERGIAEFLRKQREERRTKEAQKPTDI